MKVRVNDWESLRSELAEKRSPNCLGCSEEMKLKQHKSEKNINHEEREDHQD